MIPTHDEQGNLPAGIHAASWQELESAFGGELFPASFVAEPESGALFLDFFQRDRDGEPKGIIQVDLEGLA